MARDILDFTPPPLSTVERALKLQELWFDPHFYGLENVDAERPALYVANHTIYGSLDAPLMYSMLYREKGIVLRSLGDNFHWKVPGWGKIMTQGGAVPGSRENCSRLMEGGQHVLVFPGGGREVAKRKGEEYKLTWKTRTGFCHMAIKYQYPIIPVASLGADEAFDILYDSYDFQQSLIGKLLLKNPFVSEQLRGGDVFMPISRGVGPTILPRPERFYFAFGEPIDTEEFIGQEDNVEVQWILRKRVMDAIENGLEDLRGIRTHDDLPAWRKLLVKRKS